MPSCCDLILMRRIYEIFVRIKAVLVSLKEIQVVVPNSKFHLGWFGCDKGLVDKSELKVDLFIHEIYWIGQKGRIDVFG